MSRCEFRTSPLPVDGRVTVEGVACVNDSGHSLILCQALISLAPALKFAPKLQRVVCGLLCFDGKFCPINRFYRHHGAFRIEVAYKDYEDLVVNSILPLQINEKLEAA